MRSSVSEACFLAFHGGLYCCAALAPQANIHPRERLILSLPCDWRFLPKLGPPPLGCGPFFSTCGIMNCKGLFGLNRGEIGVIFSFVDLEPNFVATQHGARTACRERPAGISRPRDPV
jgi:hypothetical protein